MIVELLGSSNSSISNNNINNDIWESKGREGGGGRGGGGKDICKLTLFSYVCCLWQCLKCHTFFLPYEKGSSMCSFVPFIFGIRVCVCVLWLLRRWLNGVPMPMGRIARWHGNQFAFERDVPKSNSSWINRSQLVLFRCARSQRQCHWHKTRYRIRKQRLCYLCMWFFGWLLGGCGEFICVRTDHISRKLKWVFLLVLIQWFNKLSNWAIYSWLLAITIEHGVEFLNMNSIIYISCSAYLWNALHWYASLWLIIIIIFVRSMFMNYQFFFFGNVIGAELT